MKPTTRAIHSIVISLKMEEIFVRLRQEANFFRKFIPGSRDYPKDDSYSIVRDKTRYKINRSDYVQWRLFYGVRDHALQQAKRYLTSDSVVLDIGANCGGFSLRLASFVADNHYSNVQVHAFEPNPAIYERYINNCALNPAVSTIVISHGVGLGNEMGERSFQNDDSNTGVGRVLPAHSPGHYHVKIQRLDDVVARLNPSTISFIKMIVEGFEPEVFKGGWNTLRKFKPPIFFEVTPEWYAQNGSSLEEIIQPLRAIGYKKFLGEYNNELIPYVESKFKDLYQFNMMVSLDE